MRHWTVLLTAALAVASQTVSAQSMTGDDERIAVESLEVIELPADTPEKPGFDIGWDCDVLLLNTSQRYRPSSCLREDSADAEVKELQVDRVALETEAPARRKSRN